MQDKTKFTVCRIICLCWWWTWICSRSTVSQSVTALFVLKYKHNIPPVMFWQVCILQKQNGKNLASVSPWHFHLIKLTSCLECVSNPTASAMCVPDKIAANYTSHSLSHSLQLNSPTQGSYILFLTWERNLSHQISVIINNLIDVRYDLVWPARGCIGSHGVPHQVTRCSTLALATGHCHTSVLFHNFPPSLAH